MDYGKVFGRAWEITWRWKILWVFGFLASLGSGSPGINNVYNTNGQEMDLEKYAQDLPWEQIWMAISGAILAIICILFIVAIVLWVVSVIARGALIGGVQQVEEEGMTSFRSAWMAGRRKFWTLFGLGVLTGIPVLIAVVLLAIFLAAGIVAGVGLMDVEEMMEITSIVAAVVGALLLICCLLIPLGIVLNQVRIYGERAAILEDLGWIEAFKRGWRVLVENLGATIVFWLIFFVIGLVIAVFSIIILAMLSAPFLLGMAVFDAGTWMIGPAVCGGLVALVFFILLNSIVTTFTSASWTLAYRELTGVKTGEIQSVV